jgi:hypothetical protein
MTDRLNDWTDQPIDPENGAMVQQLLPEATDYLATAPRSGAAASLRTEQRLENGGNDIMTSQKNFC